MKTESIDSLQIEVLSVKESDNDSRWNIVKMIN